MLVSLFYTAETLDGNSLENITRCPINYVLDKIQTLFITGKDISNHIQYSHTADCIVGTLRLRTNGGCKIN